MYCQCTTGEWKMDVRFCESIAQVWNCCLMNGDDKNGGKLDWFGGRMGGKLFSCFFYCLDGSAINLFWIGMKKGGKFVWFGGRAIRQVWFGGSAAVNWFGLAGERNLKAGIAFMSRSPQPQILHFYHRWWGSLGRSPSKQDSKIYKRWRALG